MAIAQFSPLSYQSLGTGCKPPKLYPVTANHLIRTLSRTKHLQKVIKEYLIATVLSTEVHIPNVAKYVRNCA